MNTTEASTPRILIFYQLADVYERLIKSRIPGADIVAITDLRDEAAFRRHIPEAEILMSFAIPAQALLAAKKLRWIQAVSAGVDFLNPVRDHIRHVIVTNARGVHGDIIGEYVQGAMVMLAADLPRMMRNQAAHVWERWPRPALAGRTLGIVGLGAIGQGIATRAAAMGMRVLGTRLSGAPAEGVAQVFTPDRIGEMLALCDFVAITVPGVPQTEGLIGAAEFAAMKKGVHLVNVSRGTVVNEPALVEALRSGQVAGAFLDVFAREPLPPDSPLWTMPNVVITPHIAGTRDDTPELLTEIFLDNLARYRKGEPLRNRIDLARGY